MLSTVMSFIIRTTDSKFRVLNILQCGHCFSIVTLCIGSEWLCEVFVTQHFESEVLTLWLRISMYEISAPRPGTSLVWASVSSLREWLSLPIVPQVVGRLRSTKLL